MLAFGISAAVFLFIAMVSFRNDGNRHFSRKIFVRLGIIWLTSSLFYFIPEDQLIDFVYRNRPERAKELKENRFIEQDSLDTWQEWHK